LFVLHRPSSAQSPGAPGERCHDSQDEASLLKPEIHYLYNTVAASVMPVREKGATTFPLFIATVPYVMPVASHQTSSTSLMAKACSANAGYFEIQ